MSKIKKMNQRSRKREKASYLAEKYDLDIQEAEILAELTEGQLRLFHEKEIVPSLLIEFLQLNGLPSLGSIPRKGLPLMEFLNRLRLAMDEAIDPAARDMAAFIYNRAVEGSLMSDERTNIKFGAERVPAGVPAKPERPRTIAIQL